MALPTLPLRLSPAIQWRKVISAIGDVLDWEGSGRPFHVGPMNPGVSNWRIVFLFPPHSFVLFCSWHYITLYHQLMSCSNFTKMVAHELKETPSQSLPSSLLRNFPVFAALWCLLPSSTDKDSYKSLFGACVLLCWIGVLTALQMGCEGCVRVEVSEMIESNVQHPACSTPRLPRRTAASQLASNIFFFFPPGPLWILIRGWAG